MIESTHFTQTTEQPSGEGFWDDLADWRKAGSVAREPRVCVRVFWF